MLGFQRFETVAVTIRGIELAAEKIKLLAVALQLGLRRQQLFGARDLVGNSQLRGILTVDHFERGCYSVAYQ
jgi:hypothetical protein